MVDKNSPTSAELDFGSSAYEKRREEVQQELRAKVEALRGRVKKSRKKKTTRTPPSLFNNINWLKEAVENCAGSTAMNVATQKAERARLREEIEKQKREENARNLEAAIAAFEAGDWNAGFKLAQKRDMDDDRIKYWLGRFYEEGFMLERSPEASAEFYRDAAEEGHEDAKRRLDRMHIEGYSASFPEEVEWVSWKRCREAAERGDAEAQTAWGTILFFDEKYEEAREWHVKAEKQNNPKALYCIGRAFESGRLIDKGRDVALQYYRDAAKLGDFAAMLRLKYQFKENCELILPPDEELRMDFIKGKDGIYRKRVKTGPWLPVNPNWSCVEYRCAIFDLHQRTHKAMSKGLRAASLFDKIFGEEGPEHEGYGTGALQKWADKMVKEGKDPHYVDLREWFKGASEALDYHMGRMGKCKTFDELMEEQKQDPDHPMRYMSESMRAYIPKSDRLSRARLYEAVKQMYYTIRYAPYGIPAMGDME